MGKLLEFLRFIWISSVVSLSLPSNFEKSDCFFGFGCSIGSGSSWTTGVSMTLGLGSSDNYSLSVVRSEEDASEIELASCLNSDLRLVYNATWFFL